jgi:hypothetical protein
LRHTSRLIFHLVAPNCVPRPLADYAHLLYIIHLAISSSRLLVDMTPSPAVLLRDRVFLLTVWLILVVVAAASVGLCLARNDAAFLGIYQANTACVFAFVLAYMWRSIYQVPTRA